MAERHFEVRARSTEVLGRVLTTARTHHFVVDGPDYNDCPGEALTPPEIFLAGVLTCGVELMQVIARDEGFREVAISGTIEAMADPEDRVRDDLMVFNTVRLRFELRGVSEDQATVLVEGFQRRCPLYGSVAASCPDVAVTSRILT